MTELFLDNNMIGVTPGVSRRLHQPKKHLLNPVVRADHWWEGNQMLPYTTMYDKEEKLFNPSACGHEKRVEERIDRPVSCRFWSCAASLIWRLYVRLARPSKSPPIRRRPCSSHVSLRERLPTSSRENRVHPRSPEGCAEEVAKRPMIGQVTLAGIVLVHVRNGTRCGPET